MNRNINNYQQKQILLVDDESLVLEYLQEEFLNLGYIVHTAVSFFDAAYLIERVNFDAIVSDVILPSCNGFDVIALAKKKIPGISAVVITGFPSQEATLFAENFGVPVFSKPISFDKIVENLELQYQVRANYYLEALVA
jgi:DNA-binding NtrC family response regulator